MCKELRVVGVFQVRTDELHVVVAVVTSSVERGEDLDERDFSFAESGTSLFRVARQLAIRQVSDSATSVTRMA